MTNANNRSFDTIIVGQGLAGSALALALIERGQSVCVVDADTPGSASRVAAGLITPVTGAKLKAQPDFSELMSVATAHYRRVEQLTATSCLMQRPALRVLNKPRELEAWASADRELRGQMSHYREALPAGLHAAGMVTQMPAAARLNVAGYIDAVREYLKDNAAFISVHVESEDVVVTDDSVCLPSARIGANRLVFCRGFIDQHNPFFEALDWRPAKGQILKIRSSLKATGTVHGNGLWITPDGDGYFLVGATYEWDDLDGTTTDAARLDIETRLEALLDADYEVVAQSAGVRPIVSGRIPVAGASPREPRVMLMNGLGSKGALFAPTLAQSMAAHIVDGDDIDRRFNLSDRMA